MSKNNQNFIYLVYSYLDGAMQGVTACLYSEDSAIELADKSNESFGHLGFDYVVRKRLVIN